MTIITGAGVTCIQSCKSSAYCSDPYSNLLIIMKGDGNEGKIKHLTIIHYSIQIEYSYSIDIFRRINGYSHPQSHKQVPRVVSPGN